jgi:hypothetical protein
MDDSTKVDPDMNAPENPPDELPPDVPKARSVLMDLLEQARVESETETARLMETMKSREEDERRKAGDEEVRKAAEARARVDEERRKREEAIRSYEERKKKKEEAAKVAADGPAVVSAARPEEKPSSKVGVFVGIFAALLIVGGLAAWVLMPRHEPPSMALDRPVDMARPGSVISTPIPYGPVTVASIGEAVPAEQVVAVLVPEKYEVAPPEPRAPAVRRGAPAKPKPLINIQTGIFGGKKVVK